MRLVSGRVFRAQSRMVPELLRQAEKHCDSQATEKSAPSIIVFRINSSISKTKNLKHKNLIVCCHPSWIFIILASMALPILRPSIHLHLLSWLHSHFLYLFSSNIQSPPNSHSGIIFSLYFRFLLFYSFIWERLTNPARQKALYTEQELTHSSGRKTIYVLAG